MQANGIDTILDEDDTEYALTWLAEENDDEQDDRKKRLKLLHSYEKGRIHSLLRRVERKSYYKDLRRQSDGISRRTDTNSPCSPP